MSVEDTIRVELRQQEDFRFAVDFGDPRIPVLTTDESAPVGGGAGPGPGHLLGTAVANCLAASLLFAMRKFKNDPAPMRAVATIAKGRNEQKRLRVVGIAVDLHIGLRGADVQMCDRILAQFEDFCIVTQSVRAAIPVTVRVIDRDGAVIWPPPA
jgi:organic hydroperoxide reductase OsmC/OhrA